MTPSISIVIPFFSTPESLFRSCMKSILNAERSDFEVIVVDDGSPELYYPSMDRFADDYRVKIVHCERQGVSAARNTGLCMAAGKWITFVDSDDYLDSSTLARILDLALTHHEDVILFNGGQDKNGVISRNHFFLHEDHDYGINEQDRIALMESALSLGKIPEGYKQYFTLGSPCCKLLKTSFLKENGLRFDEKIKFAEDTLFMLAVYNKARHVVYFDWYLYNYVVNHDSATRRFRPGLSDDMDAFFERTKQFIQKNHLYEALEKAYYIRAQLEVSRAFAAQYFHPQNHDRKAGDSYKAFIAKEPYRTGLQRKYIQPENLRQKFMSVIIEHGWGLQYNLLKTIKKHF